MEPEISIGSLHPYYTYLCRVATHTIGVGPYTNSTVVQTDEAGAVFLDSALYALTKKA